MMDFEPVAVAQISTLGVSHLTTQRSGTGQLSSPAYAFASTSTDHAMGWR
jgi:hypothetical protein